MFKPRHSRRCNVNVADMVIANRSLKTFPCAADGVEVRAAPSVDAIEQYIENFRNDFNPLELFHTIEPQRSQRMVYERSTR